jgi:hypothetical protein
MKEMCSLLSQNKLSTLLLELFAMLCNKAVVFQKHQGSFHISTDREAPEVRILFNSGTVHC